MAINRYVLFQTQAFATETFGVFGTAALGHPIDQVSEDISHDHGFVNPVTSAKRAARNRLLGPITGGGDLGVPMYSLGFSTLAYYALGKDVTVAGTPAANWKHTLTPATTVPAFRMAVGKDLNQHEFVGCAMKSMKLDYTTDAPALATFDVMVRRELSPPGSLITPTFPDYDVAERPFLGVEVLAEFDDTPNLTVRSFDVEINNTLVEDNHTFGSRYVPVLVVQELEVKGSFSMTYSDLQVYLDVLDENEPKIEFLFQHDAVGVTEHRFLNVILPKVSLDVGKLPTDGNKEYIVSVDFTAEAVTNDDEVIILEINNEEAVADHIA